jgi:hypothetical protein
MDNIPQQQQATIDLLRELIAKACPKGTYEIESNDVVHFSWSREDRYFEVSVHSDGLCDWFVSVVVNGARMAQGNNDEPVAMDEKKTLYWLSFF